MIPSIKLDKTITNVITNYHDSYLVKYPDINSNLLSRYITLSILSLSPTTSDKKKYSDECSVRRGGAGNIVDVDFAFSVCTDQRDTHQSPSSCEYIINLSPALCISWLSIQVTLFVLCVSACTCTCV